MASKPTYEELEQRVRELEFEVEKNKDVVRRLDQHEQILSSIRDTILIITPGLKTIYANQTAKDVFGDLPEMFAEPCYRFFKNRKTVCEECPVLKAIHDEKPHKAIMKSCDKDGKEMWRFNMAFPFYDINGKVIAGIEIVTDYTSQKKAETALKKSEKRLVEAQRMAGMGDFTWDYESGEVTWSDAMFDLLKYDKEEIIDYARVNAEIHHPDDLERITEWLNHNVASGNKILIPNEYRAFRKDGAMLYIRTAGVIEREEGKSPKIFAAVQDITDLKRSEQALVRRSEFERLISEISSELLGLTFDQIDKGIERALGTIATFSGADRAYVFLLHDDGVLVENTHEWCAEDIEPQIENLKDIPLEKELPWFAKHIGKGEVFHVPNVTELPTDARLEREHFEAQDILSLIVAPMLLRGRLVGFLGFDAVHEYRTWTEDDQALLRLVGQVMTNAIERKRSDEALRKSEEKYRTIFNNVQVGIFRTRISDGKVLDCNDRFAKTYGYIDRKACIENFVASERYIDPVVREDMADSLLKDGKVDNFEACFHSIDGRHVWIRFSAQAFPENDYLEGVGYDVTEEKRALEELLTSEAKYRRLAENSPAVVFQLMMKPDGTLTFPYISKAISDFTGISAEKVLNDSSKLLDMVHPEDRDLFYGGVLKSANSLDSYHEIIRCVKDGELIWVEARATPSITPTGSILWDGFFNDITKRKRAEDALRTAEETYRNLFLNSQIGLFRTEINTGLILDANDAVAHFIGFKDRNELLAEPFNIAERYVDPEAREKMISLLKRGGEFRNYEARFRRNDGSILWMRYSARIVSDKGWIEGVSEDVTEQKLAEISLRKSEERFSKLFFSSPTWMAITRIEDDTYLEVNNAFEHTTGFERNEVIGRTSLELGILADPDRRNQLIDLAREKGGFREEEITFIAKGGETITALWSSEIIELTGETCLLSTIMDISELRRSREERKNLEKRLHRAQRMEAMGLLAGGVAHDLNNILSGIVTYPELILMDLPEDSHYRKPLQTIQESGARAADVVADLLTIARGVATGKESLNLNATIREILVSAEFKELERTHAYVDFSTDLEAELLNMDGSPIHIKKMLINLLFNATEAIGISGTVTLMTRNRYLDEPLRGYEEVRKGEYVVLGVSDDGAGISSEDMERIFEPFYTKKAMGRSGTGLGLAVVWNTVQDHNGYIHVNSSDNGTVFELYFPVTREEIAEKKESLALEEYVGHGERILVVDDEETQREIATGIMTKLGYHAEAVSSGEEAIEYVKEYPVDLILLDMVMPKGINGRETYEEIVKIHPGQKAIIASGYSKNEEVEAAQKLGVGKYIRKPYLLEKIGLAVKEELTK